LSITIAAGADIYGETAFLGLHPGKPGAQARAGPRHLHWFFVPFAAGGKNRPAGIGAGVTFRHAADDDRLYDTAMVRCRTAAMAGSSAVRVVDFMLYWITASSRRRV